MARCAYGPHDLDAGSICEECAVDLQTKIATLEDIIDRERLAMKELGEAIQAELIEWNAFCGLKRPEGAKPLNCKDARLMRAIFTSE